MSTSTSKNASIVRTLFDLFSGALYVHDAFDYITDSRMDGQKNIWRDGRDGKHEWMDNGGGMDAHT